MTFPAFIELKGRPVLVIGSGPVAVHKIEVLRGFGAEITDRDPVMVVIATDDHALNRQLAAEWKRKCALVNVVDDPEACTFTFGAMVRAENVVVGVSTNGQSPVAAQWLRDRIRPLISERLLKAVRRLGALRRTMTPGIARRDYFKEEFRRCIEEDA